MENAGQKSGLKAKVQRLGSYLSGMVMPNIGAFIAWGVITALFIDTGWLPNKELSSLVSPMLTYLLPLLIGYTGGSMIHGQRGAVVGAIATMGVIVGSDVPMFIGAMIMGPLGGWCIKKFDDAFQAKIKAGFEMLVNNFSSGLIGFALAIIAYYAIGPVVEGATHLMAQGVETIINMHLLPLANIFIEPAKILFLNNAINHGILTPLGAEQAAQAGKSILFLLEANPGPGLGILLAFTFFGKGSAKSSAPGAIIIQFLGGIHEIYFPYVMMKPLLFLAVMAGGVAGTFTFQLLGAGLQAAASPGSIFAILAMTPRGGYLPNLAGIAVACAVSFLVAMIILKTDHNEEDDLAATQASVANAKAESKGKAAVKTENQEMFGNVNKIIFACDAGMGSSAMGASVLRDKVKKAGLSLPVSNSAINNLTDDPNALIVTQEELHDRASQKAPSATFVQVENFMNSPRYDEIVERLSSDSTPTEEPKAKLTDNVVQGLADYSKVDHIVFAYDQVKGSANMGATILKKLMKNNALHYPVVVVAIKDLKDETNALIITNNDETVKAEQQAPSAMHVPLTDLVASEKYDQVIQNLRK
ncbi:PTS mannitol transporter subunit IICBA [Enterococcus hermanniensis]|uniref:PTS system mannitol-specific EIICB component n=1 Tax=Enterococcus hermanniensis TaxID=249189 RepID=A0A1L8TRL9_9ENTE|nr:PTS mannitol transporter subunit IICBA [Enterococcus hermanniensis]OJG46930.1 PTS system, mannitol-specific IIC component [Enterococcus hermanniensis]